MIVSVPIAYCPSCGSAVEYERVSDAPGWQVFACNRVGCEQFRIKYKMPQVVAERYYPIPKLLTKDKVA